MTVSGRVVTFYSYKGGTGRTMAMANVAWILASNGHRVVVIDWDLEAPGLHRFLGPALSDPDQKATNGLIDFLMEYVLAATRGKDDPAVERWYEPYTNVMRFAQPVSTGFSKGCLDMIGAGRQNAEYAERVNMFDWRSFYERFQGRGFLDAVFAKLRDKYDFILIDSRTGVSDTSGICTVHLPDTLVVLFTMNAQSIDGASGVALDARRQRDNKLEIYPVPTRIELAELDRLQAARVAARARFEPIVKGLDSAGNDYLVDMEVPHVAYYLYEEQLAAVVEGGRARVLLALYEKLTAYVSGGKATRLALLPEKELDAARARFRSGKAPGSTTNTKTRASKRHDVFLSYAERDEALALRIREELSNLMSVFTPSQDIKAGWNVGDATRDAIGSSTAVVVLLTGTGGSASSRVDAAIALARELDVPVIPVHVGSAQAPDSLRDVAAIRGSLNEPGHIAEQVRSAMLASDRDGRSANERIATLFAERNKLQADAKRRRRYMVFSVGLLASIAVTAIIVIYWLENRTRKVTEDLLEQAETAAVDVKTKLQTAQTERNECDKSIAANKAALADAQVQLLSLESQFEQMKNRLAELRVNRSLPANVHTVIEQAAVTQESLRESVQQVAKQAGAATKPVEVDPMVLVFAPPDDTDSTEVQGAATALEAKGFALGRKRVFPGRPPNGVTEVRFFRNPEDRDEANKILEILKRSAHLSEGRISFVIDPDIKRHRYFEVRLTKTAFASP